MTTSPRAGRRFRLQDRDSKRAEIRQHVQRMGRLKVVAWCLVPVVIAISAVLSADWVAHLDDDGLPLVQGSVEAVEEVRNWLIMRSELSIRVDGSDEVVRARLALDRADAFPDRVTFHYGGDPAREVRLVGEKSPLWVSVLLLLLSIAGAIGAPFAERHYRRQLQRLDDEQAADPPPDVNLRREG